MQKYLKIGHHVLDLNLSRKCPSGAQHEDVGIAMSSKRCTSHRNFLTTLLVLAHMDY